MDGCFRAPRSECPPVFFGKRLGPAVSPADNMLCRAGGEKRSGFLMNHFVAEVDSAGAHGGHARADTQHVVIPRRPMVTALRFGDHDVAIVLKLHLFVGRAHLTDGLDAPDLEPDEIMGVIYDAKLVGFGVAHADRGFVELLHGHESVPLVSTPDRFALFEKRSKTFLKIACGADAGVFLDGALEIGVDRGRRGIAQQALGPGEAGGARGNQTASQLSRGVHQFFGGDNAGNHTKFLRFHGIHDAAGEKKIARALFADLPDQKDGHKRRDEPDAHFRVAKLRIGDSQREVAERGDAAPAGNRGPVHRGDQRLGETPKGAKHPGHAARFFEFLLGRLLGDRGERVEIHARAEGLARAGHNNRARGRALGFAKRAEKVFDHLRGNGIALLRTVQGKRADLARDFQEQRRVGHFRSFSPQFTSGAWAYRARISLVNFRMGASAEVSIPVVAPALARAARTVSVAMLPTRSSPAKGQPPRPVTALSNLRQPASYAARIFSAAPSGWLWRCTPSSMPATEALTAAYNLPTSSGVAVPTVSASETVRTLRLFSHSSVSWTISGPQGSS